MVNDFKWYIKDGKELCDSLYSYVKTLRTDQQYRQDQNYQNMRLYGNMEVFALKNYAYYRAEASSAIQNRVTLNIVQSMIDTVVSKISKNRPKPSFLTDGGDWSMQRRAKKLTQFVEGQFYASDFYDKRFMALQDSCIFGTGALKFYRTDKDIKIDRVFIDELTVDETEAAYGEIRQLHQTKLIDKDVLKAMFPDKAKEIDVVTAQEISYYASNTQPQRNEVVEVIESWHLPSVKGADDGKHAIVIDKLTLFEEPYNRDYFPFLFWRWGVRPTGFWGQGIAEQLTGIQLEINKILRTIQVSMHLVSVPKIFVEASSKVVSSHLNNKVGGIIKYVGQPPIEGKLGTIPPDLFNHLDRLYARAYEIVGVSQLSAQAAKPQGLNSGKALREYNDIESERFMSVQQRDEQTVVHAAKMLVDLAKDIYEEFGEYKIKTKGTRGMEELDWADVNLDDDKYIMQVFPVSALSKTPAGRMQDVQDLMGMGFLDKADAMKLLDYPDLKQFYNFANAGVEDIERTIEDFIEKGVYQTPEPYQNLQLGITKMQQAYLMYRSANAPEERLDLFRRWIEDAQALMSKVLADQQAQIEQQKAELMAQQAPEAAPPEAALAPEAGLPPEAELPPEAMLPPEGV